MKIQGSEMEFGDKFSYVTEDLKKYYIYEINSTALLHQYIKKTDKCVDVGAHIGYYTLMMSRLGARVVAFEPSDYNYQLLKKNMELNKYENIRIVNAAISDEDTKMNFHLSDKCTGMNYLDDRSVQIPNYVPVNRLDTIFREIDVLKIDVEGFETKVLRGMGRLRPRIILVEDYPLLRLERGDDPKKMYELLSDYDCIKADNNLFCTLKKQIHKTEAMKETVSVGCI